MPPSMDLTGHRYGRLSVVSRSEVDKFKWICLCDCGKQIIVYRGHLRDGHTQSCGCLRSENMTTHGMSDTDEFRIWKGIIKRCTNPKDVNYEHYGGRGISICDRWKNSFENFYADMGPRPSPKHSVDRLENNGDYEPSNCRWATDEEQANNKNNNVTYEYDGQRYTVAQLARLCEISHPAMVSRLKKYDGDVEKAVRHKRWAKKSIDLDDGDLFTDDDDHLQKSQPTLELQGTAMADNGFRPAPRPKNALDNKKLGMRAPNATGQYASLQWSLVNNNPRITVYTNDANDTKDYGKISANLDAPTFFSFLTILKKAIDAPIGEKIELPIIENSNFIFPGGKRSEKPVVVSRLIVGRDEDGTIWISVTAQGRPNIKFPFTSPEFHSLIRKNGEKISAGELSAIYASAYHSMLSSVMAHCLVSLYTEPPPKDGQGGGNRGGGFNRGGGGGGGYNRGSQGGGNSGGGSSGGSSGGSDDGFDDTPW